MCSKTSLSLRPSLRSGIPESSQFIMSEPTISECSGTPVDETRRLTCSITSRKTCTNNGEEKGAIHTA